jgi:Protein of unknown function (DUF3352)
MRRLLATAALLACVALIATGCGGHTSSSGGLDSTLSYMPKDSPIVVALDTDQGDEQYKSLDKILDKFPFGDQIKELLVAKLAKGVSFEDDVKPLLGNPFVISATGVRTFLGRSSHSDFVAAIEVDDKGAVSNLIDKTKPTKHGEVAGATVYDDQGTYFAVEDRVVVFGGSQEVLEAALKRADGGDHLDTRTFERGLAGLPTDPIARVYVDVQALLGESSDGRRARKNAWVAALRTLGLTVTTHDSSIDVDFNLKTDPSNLTDKDLPLPPGDQAPKVVKQPGALNVAVRDPRRIVGVLGKQLGIGALSDVIGQLRGDVSVSISLDGAFAARAQLKDPNAFSGRLGTLAGKRRGDLYEARLKGGKRVVFGVVNGVLVVASNAARAHQIAAAKPESVPGAKGSLVLSADAERLAARLLEQLRPALGLPSALPTNIFARPLRDLTGSATTSTYGIKGRLTLTLD